LLFANYGSLTTLLSRITAAPPTAAQIVTQLLTTTVNGHTVQDLLATDGAYHIGNATVTRDSSAKTITVVYTDGAVTYTVVSSFSDSGLTLQTGRTVTITGLP
jgi:hypothetical protein